MLVHKGGKIKNWGGECRDVTPTKLQSQNIFKESTGGGGGVGLGGQDGFERRIKVFVFFLFFFFVGGGRVKGGGGGGQGRCEQRSEVFCENSKKKKIGGGGWGRGGQVWGRGVFGGRGGHRVAVNKVLKFL